jgi:UDPglucose--hexose-1-phosphate uridylyltransferase
MGAAPEWRFDPMTGRRVLIAPDRADRPMRPGVSCPFCEGHESATPPEVLAFRDPGSQSNGAGWRVRVVPNRYAAVRMDLPGSGLTTSEAGAVVPGIGIAEVFLEGPRHETAFRNLPMPIATDSIRAWRDRLRFWRDDGRLEFALVFKNEGPTAGASVEHCHSQLIGLPFVPPMIVQELDHVASLTKSAGACPFCRWIETERRGPRLVAETDAYIVLCPFAPRFPGETWVLPTLHAPRFESLRDVELERVAVVLQDLLARMHRASGGADFNVIVKSAPFRHDGPYHWRLEVLPRATSTAGWEWGTGLFINTMFPERAAELLRDV